MLHTFPPQGLNVQGKIKIQSVFPNFHTATTNTSPGHDAGFGTDVASPTTSTKTADKLIICDKRDVIRKTVMVKTTYGEVWPIGSTSFFLVLSDDALVSAIELQTVPLTCKNMSRTSCGAVLTLL